MNRWVYKGFDETYKRIGADFDKVYYESETYLLGKELVEEGLRKKVFFLKDDGSARLWYCNINTPPELNGETLTYIDLDIDILVQPDFSFQVLDEDEFETNAGLYGYSPEEKLRARSAVDELIAMIEQHYFPFVVESSPVSTIVSVPGSVAIGSRDSALSADPVATAPGTDTPSNVVNS